MKVYKVRITGIVTTADDDTHPDYWSWSDKDLSHRIKDMGNTINVVITELTEVGEVTTIDLVA